MPIVHVAKTVRNLTPGELLSVRATDPAFPADIKAWAAMTGNELVELESGTPIRATIRIR